MSNLNEIAKRVFAIEVEAIRGLADRLTADFGKAAEAILACDGRVVVCGMGKSGLIGRKISATLASTGTPAIFMHPAEALHGDLGMLRAGDIFLSISKSGETDELLRITPLLPQMGIAHLAVIGNLDSTLARYADWVLDVTVGEEACPLQLAPTASTTATLAMGDALAMTLMEMRDFQPESFASFHPGGSLGRRLLLKVEDLMRKDNLPLLDLQASAKDLISTISKGRLGLVIIIQDNEVCGIITDGDVRRAMEHSEQDFFSLKMGALLTPSPISISPMTKVIEAENLMRKNKINSLLVTQGKQLLGVIQIYDL